MLTSSEAALVVTRGRHCWPTRLGKRQAQGWHRVGGLCTIGHGKFCFSTLIQEHQHLLLSCWRALRSLFLLKTVICKSSQGREQKEWLAEPQPEPMGPQGCTAADTGGRGGFGLETGRKDSPLGWDGAFAVGQQHVCLACQVSQSGQAVVTNKSQTVWFKCQTLISHG